MFNNWLCILLAKHYFSTVSSASKHYSKRFKYVRVTFEQVSIRFLLSKNVTIFFERSLDEFSGRLEMPLDVGLWEIKEIEAHVLDGAALVKVGPRVHLAGQFALGAVQHVSDADPLQVLFVSRCSPETPIFGTF